MRRILFVACLIATGIFSASAFGQITNVTNETSTPTPGSGHDSFRMLNETVNPANGSVSLRISVPIPKGRGLTLPFSFDYDSDSALIMFPTNGSAAWELAQGTISGAGWSYSAPLLNYSQVQQPQSYQGKLEFCPWESNFVYQGPSGGGHPLDIATRGPNSQYPSLCPPDNITPGGDDLVKGAFLNCTPSERCNEVAVADADGTTALFNDGLPGVQELANSVTDRNGNTVTISWSGSGGAFSYTDELGRTALSSTGFGTAAGQSYKVYVSGLSNPYTIYWGSTTASFGVGSTNVTPGGTGSPYCNGVGQLSQTVPAISAIVLPNGQAFHFYYDSTYGLLDEIDYPSGGWIKYTWEVDQNGSGLNGSELAQVPPEGGGGGVCSYVHGWPRLAERQVSFDGSAPALTQTFSYTTTWGSSPTGGWTSKETDVATTDNVTGASQETFYTYVGYPLGNNQPVGIISPSFGAESPEEQQVVYDNGSLQTLRVGNKSWNDPYEMTCVSITQDGLTSRTDYAHGPGVQITDKKEWDWTRAPACGSSTSGTPTRETQTAYASFPATSIFPAEPSIFDRPSSIVTYGSGARAAETDYSFDSRGNATQGCRWLNTTGGTLCTGYAYDGNGQMTSMTDPRGNTTQYSYSSAYDDAYLTQITYPSTGVAHVESFSYNYDDGQLASSSDQNGNVTSYSYSDPLGRLTTISYPDGGKTQYSYNDSPPSPSVTTERLISGGTYTTSESIMDGVGHVVRTELTSDPVGTDYTDSTYDGEGRVMTQSNPYRSTSDPTYGVSTTTYDALGSVTSINRPDGSVASTAYSGNCATATDESSRARETCSDALGRLTDVYEDPSGLNYHTTYSYDALDNLLTAVDGSQTHSFTYDSLSRELSATNPESGTTSYTYDPNGNVATRTDARGITTTNTYDALNRLTWKNYSDSTPAVNYDYDRVNIWMNNTLIPVSNGDGRVGVTCVLVGTNCNAMDGYSYDAMGRVIDHWQCSLAQCTATPPYWHTHYDFDLAGDVKDWTHPAGFTITNTVNTAQQVTQMSYTPADATHPANLVPGITYTPWGAEQTLEDGCVGSGCTNTVETYAYNNRLQPVMIELGSTSNPSADSCLVYNYYAIEGSPASCAMPTQGTGDNGNVMGYAYQDNQTTLSPNLGHTATFQYDALNRLINAQATGSVSYELPFSYTVDGSDGRYGNVTCVINASTSGLCPTYSFNSANNRITNPGYTYDAAGNLTSDGTYTYQYDAEGRRQSVMEGGTPITSLTYNANGQVVSLLYQVYGNHEVVGVFSPAGRELGYYDGASGDWFDRDIWAAGRMVAQSFPESFEGGLIQYLHANALGSDSQITIQTGAVGYDILYYPWGEYWKHAGSQGDSHFARFQQTAGIASSGTPTRRYSMSEGRWLTPDPAGMSAADLSNPQSWNAYAYALNNPTTRTDPSGLYVCNGSQEECRTIYDALNIVRRAESELKAEPQEKENLQGVLKFYGKEGVKNGVTVTFGNLGGKEEANTVTRSGFLGLHKQTTITFDLTQIQKTFGAATPDEAAGITAHEGQHGVDQRAFGNPQNRAEEHATELRAFGAQSSVAEGLGATEGRYNLWNAGWHSPPTPAEELLREQAVQSNAQRATDLWCSLGGNCQ